MRAHLPDVFDPARFQGAKRRRRYFEGYYFKIVDPVHDLAMAFIPGLSYDEQGRGHAFVQVIDGVAGQADYHRFGIGEFEARDRKMGRWVDGVMGGCAARGTRPAGTSSHHPIASSSHPTDTWAQRPSAFDLRVGGSGFRESGIEIDLPGLRADFGFRQNHPWPWRPWSPGAMGPFSFVPGMQCKHGILSLHHLVSGRIQRAASAKTPSLDLALSPAAVGYLEKDWGSSFPRRWTWLQSNHFDGIEGPCCLTVSRGVVPWITGAFEGFIVGLLWPGGFVRFTTYNGASCHQTITGDTLRLELRRGKRRLTIETPVPQGGADLAAPQAVGGMSGKVNECLTARATLEYREGERIVLATELSYVGAELGGVGQDE